MPAILILLIFCSTLFADLPTYFQYQTSSLEDLHSSYCLTEGELDEHQALLKQVCAHQEISNFQVFRLLTYLAIAQRDAAFLSYRVKGCFEGSLDPLFVSLLHLFFPNETVTFDIKQDPYSEQLCHIVFEQFKSRYERDAAHPEVLAEPAGWEIVPAHRRVYAYWCPSIVSTLSIPPPTKSLKKEWKKFHQLRKSVTEKHLLAAKEWEKFCSMGEGCKTWFDIADQYMSDEKIFLAKQLQVKACLAIAMFDALEGTFRAKFIYHTKRPFMLDPTVSVAISPPHSPGYPSGHAAMGAASSEILSYYFPEGTKRWRELCQECAQSRIWAGVHFPEDIQAGIDYGKGVAKNLLSSLTEE